MNKIQSYLFNLRDTDFERYEYLKDFVEFLELGYDLSKKEIDELKKENELLKKVYTDYGYQNRL